MFALRRRSSRDTRFRLPLAPLVGLAALCLASSARANTYHVTNPVDGYLPIPTVTAPTPPPDPVPLPGSLSEVILTANAHANSLNAGGSPDVIVFDVDVTRPLTLTTDPNRNSIQVDFPAITEAVIVEGLDNFGNSHSLSRNLQATDNYRLLTAYGVNIVVRNLSLINGSAVNNSDPTKDPRVWNLPTGAVPPPAGLGGGIYSNGTILTVDNCFFYLNKTTATAYSAGFPNAGDGGAIYKTGGTSFSLTNSSFVANNATGLAATATAPAVGGRGGGVFSTATTLTIDSTSFVDVPTASPPIPGNNASRGGGAIYNSRALTLTNSFIQGSIVSAGVGGGLWNNSPSQSTIATTTFYRNSTSAGPGGGIYNVGPLRIDSTSFVANVASGGLPRPVALSAGGGGIANLGNLQLLQCTFGDNSTAAPAGGSLVSQGTSLLYHCTMVSRTGSGAWNKGLDDAGPTPTYADMTSTHTIFQTTGPNMVNDNGAALTSVGYNLSSDATGPNDGQSDIFNTDPLLKVIQQIDGPTPVYVPRKGSPVIDTGNPSLIPGTFDPTLPFLSVPIVDQRGDPRLVGAAMDIGAVERIDVIQGHENNVRIRDDGYITKENGQLIVADPGVFQNDGPQTGFLDFPLTPDPLTPFVATVATKPAHGKVTLNTTGGFVYTPDPYYVGPDSFTYTLLDRYAESAYYNGKTFGVVSINVQHVNQPPVIDTIPDIIILANQPMLFPVSFTDYDVPVYESASFTGYTATVTDANGAATFLSVSGPVTPISGTTNRARFTVGGTSPSQVGVYRVLVTVTDTGVLKSQKFFNVRVIRPNNAPTLNAIPNQTVRVNQLLRLTATATDPDITNGDSLTFSLTSAPSGMTIDPVRGVITWTPTTPGTYTATVQVKDLSGATNSKTFTITVTPDPNASALIVVTGATATRQNASVVTVTLAMKNNGNGTATSVKLNSAQLGTLNAALISPATTINGGAQGTLTIAFNGGTTAIKRGNTVFQYTGSYLSQGKTVIFSGKITIPLP